MTPSRLEEMGREYPFQIICDVRHLEDVEGMPGPGTLHECIGGASCPVKVYGHPQRVFGFKTSKGVSDFAYMLRMLGVAFTITIPRREP